MGIIFLQMQCTSVFYVHSSNDTLKLWNIETAGSHFSKSAIFSHELQVTTPDMVMWRSLDVIASSSLPNVSNNMQLSKKRHALLGHIVRLDAIALAH